MTQPLEPGEHVDLDEGPLTQVHRGRDGYLFVLSDHDGNRVYASPDNIRTVAALAGVIDDQREPAP